MSLKCFSRNNNNLSLSRLSSSYKTYVDIFTVREVATTFDMDQAFHLKVAFCRVVRIILFAGTNSTQSSKAVVRRRFVAFGFAKRIGTARYTSKNSYLFISATVSWQHSFWVASRCVVSDYQSRILHSAYFRLKKIICGIKDQARVCHPPPATGYLLL